MMKFWEDWKEKLKKFLKADVLAFYMLWRKQADYYHEHMCISYTALFLILLFVSFYSIYFAIKKL